MREKLIYGTVLNIDTITNMKKTPIIAAVLLLALVSCSDNKANNARDKESRAGVAKTETPSIEGCWVIENVVVSDSVYAMPVEETPGVRQYATFKSDSSFTFNTNCNIITGSYSQNGTAFTIGNDMGYTEMACDNTRVEELVKQVLPEIVSLDFQNDSIVRLGATAGPKCIVLRKAQEPLKCVVK